MSVTTALPVSGVPMTQYSCDATACHRSLRLAGNDGPQLRRIATAAAWHFTDQGTHCPTHRPTPGEDADRRSEEHTSELQSLMRISYAVFCLKKKNKHQIYTRQSFT